MHLHSVVHVHQVAVMHVKGLQIRLLCEDKAQVAPGVAGESVICGAQQHAGQATRSRHILQRFQQSSPKALIPARISVIQTLPGALGEVPDTTSADSKTHQPSAVNGHM